MTFNSGLFPLFLDYTFYFWIMTFISGLHTLFKDSYLGSFSSCSTWTVFLWVTRTVRRNQVVNRFFSYLPCIPRPQFMSRTKSIDSRLSGTMLLCQIWFTESSVHEFNFTSRCQVQCWLLTSHMNQCHLLNTEPRETNGWKGRTERRWGEEIKSTPHPSLSSGGRE